MYVHMHSHVHVCRGWRTTSLQESVLYISHVGPTTQSRWPGLAECIFHLSSHSAGPIFSTLVWGLRMLTLSDMQVVVFAKWKTGVLIHCWWNRKGLLLWKTIWQFLKRLNIVSMWLSSFPSRYILRGTEDTCLHKNLYTNVMAEVTETVRNL